MSDLPAGVVVVNNSRVGTIVPAIAGANTDSHYTLNGETGAHSDYVPLGTEDCTGDSNYTCLQHNTNSSHETNNTAHQVTVFVNTIDPASYDYTYTQSAYNNNVGSFASNVTTESSSYDNNVGPATLVEQQETVCVSSVMIKLSLIKLIPNTWVSVASISLY